MVGSYLGHGLRGGPTILCGNCQHVIPNDSRFCSYCGERQFEESSQVVKWVALARYRLDLVNGRMEIVPEPDQETTEESEP